MCGIAGIWNLNGTQLEIGSLESFTDSLIERGPDGAGYDYFNNNSLGLGHRRLSILDLSSAGRQPMYFANRRYAITYNGEIFNFLEIREELEKYGYNFITQTDTEVVLAAYHKWGEHCLQRFNGMWAMAIWDDEQKSLFLSRDRFGIKPLFYNFDPDKRFAFASESRAFKVLDHFDRDFDMEMVELSIKNIRIQGSGFSIYKGIFQILPGHKMTIKSGDRTINQKRWWNIADHLRNDIPKTLEKQSEEYYSIFRDACKIRLVSDVPLATALSGGLDSTSVYSTVFDLLKNDTLNRTYTDSQKAFVATFPGLISDERHYAEEALKFTGGPAIFLDQNLNNLPEQIVADTIKYDSLYNSPITSVSGIYRGMKSAGITVSMDGHGVDEMIYGYRDMIYNLFYHFYRKGDYKMAAEIRKVLVPTYHISEQDGALANIQRLMKTAKSPTHQIKRIVKKIIKGSGSYQDNYSTNEKITGLGEPYNFDGLSYPDKIVYRETFIDTLPSIFRDFDKASMMNSVEIRMPFMDWRLVSYMFSLPFESKIGKGFNKLILREAMKGKMSEAIRTRTHKVGIGSPVQHWFRNQLKPWVQDTLHSQELQSRLYILNKNDIESLDKAYESGTVSNEQVFRAWYEINLHIINRK